MPMSVLPFPTIDPVLIAIGPFAIRWYALAYIAGLLLGWLYARALVRRCFAALIEADARPPTSPKNRLQEWTLGRGLGLPVYGLLQSSGPAHAPRFIVNVLAAGREAQGEGDSKRAAEQAAAAAWLKELNT